MLSSLSSLQSFEITVLHELWDTNSEVVKLVWRNKHIRVALRVRLNESMVMSAVLYTLSVSVTQ